MFKLPADLQMYIYTFDSTFHQIYYFLKIEFFLKLTLWRIKWLNPNIDYGDMNKQKELNLSDFKSTQKGIDYLVNYWNKTHPYYYGISTEQNNCEKEFITDNYHASIYLFNTLKTLKNWKVKEDEIIRDGIICKKMVLYKPGKK